MDFNTDFTKIIKKEHEGKWVALSENGTEVIAYSDSLMDLKAKIGERKVTYMKAPRSDIAYAF